MTIKHDTTNQLQYHNRQMVHDHFKYNSMLAVLFDLMITNTLNEFYIKSYVNMIISIAILV